MLITCRKNAGRELKLEGPLAVYGEDGNVYRRDNENIQKVTSADRLRINYCMSGLLYRYYR